MIKSIKSKNVKANLSKLKTQSNDSNNLKMNNLEPFDKLFESNKSFDSEFLNDLKSNHELKQSKNSRSRKYNQSENSPPINKKKVDDDDDEKNKDQLHNQISSERKNITSISKKNTNEKSFKTPSNYFNFSFSPSIQLVSNKFDQLQKNSEREIRENKIFEKRLFSSFSLSNNSFGHQSFEKRKSEAFSKFSKNSSHDSEEINNYQKESLFKQDLKNIDSTDQKKINFDLNFSCSQINTLNLSYKKNNNLSKSYSKKINYDFVPMLYQNEIKESDLNFTFSGENISENKKNYDVKKMDFLNKSVTADSLSEIEEENSLNTNFSINFDALS